MVDSTLTITTEQTAMAIACASDESEVIRHTGTALRIMLGVGAYGEAADDTRGSGSTTLALRLKYEGQGEELTCRFPGTHVSAVTDPRSISIVGPADELHELFCYAREHERLQVQKMDIRGQVHNPDNASLAVELCSVCLETPSLRLPDSSKLRVPVRSNRTGKPLVEGSLTEELVTTILASRCEWWSLLNEVAKDIELSKESPSPRLVYFGLTDCVATTPFVKLGLRPSKLAAHTLIPRVERIPTKDTPHFPEDAVAVVGASCRLPGANNLDALWELLATGTDCHRELPKDRFDLQGSYRASQSGNFLKDRRFFGNFIDNVQRFDNGFFGINPREAASMDPQQRILLEVAYEALEDAGYLKTHRRESGDRVGCFIGASLVEYLDNTNAYAPTAYTSTGTIRAFLCGRLSYYFGWSGPAEVIDTACSSSLVAINRACKAVQSGECSMALAGGINIITGMNNYFDLGKAGFLSPTGQCKPFDISADGYCRSDGAGLVVLKKLKHAIASGDAILGVIPGITTNQGGLSASITVPQSTAQQALYRSVLRQAGLPPGSVTYVESHGTGTQAGDPLEMESIRSVFSRKGSSETNNDTLFIGSIKGNLGHCETAAGVAGLLKVLAMIKHKMVPPQANHTRLNPKIAALEPDGLAINRILGSWDVPFRAALVNSYGAAGSNCALLCCEMPPAAPVFELGPQLKNLSLPLLIGGATEKSLMANVRVLGAFLNKNTRDLNLADVAYTLQRRRPGLKYMASVEATDIKGAVTALDSLALSAVHQLPQTPLPVVFVFSGQSSTKVGLDRSFFDRLPAFREQVEACNKELQKLEFPSIIPAIFEMQPLKDAYSLQCSMFALQYASAQCWIQGGLKPDAVVGHSLGELTALAVSGVLSLGDALKLVAMRARLIDANWGSDKGSMLALGNCSTQDFELLASLVKEKAGPQAPVAEYRLEIACYNGPMALVAVGTSAAIDAAEGIARTESKFRSIKPHRLGTSHGFHSVLTEPLMGDLNTLSSSLRWNEPEIPLEACKAVPTGSFTEYDPSLHLREPVYFSRAIRRLEERFGPSLWLEAGVDTAAVPLARAAAAQPHNHVFLALKTQGKPQPLDGVNDVVTGLWRSGHLATTWHLLPTDDRRVRGCKPVWLPPYQFEQTPHWLPNIDNAAEMQKLLEKASSAIPESHIAQKTQSTPPPRLVVRRSSTPTPGGPSGLFDFVINTDSQRFSKLVGGHAVRSRSICPASMYMECVTMALQLLLGDSTGTTHNSMSLGQADLSFDSLSFSLPLGVNPLGEVVLRLEVADKPNSWKYTVRTLLKAGESGRQAEVFHAVGNVSLGEVGPSSHEAVQRLVTNAFDRMVQDDDDDVERIRWTRAYSLFARVVDYAPPFRAIRKLSFRGQEGVATVSLPEEQPGRQESTSWKLCDAVALDAFVQVVGLIMNTSDSVANDEVMVMVGLNHATISPKCKMSEEDNHWQVYARFDFDADNQPIGDVFVCTERGELVAILTGCRFSKLPVLKLEKSLDHAMSRTSRAHSQQQTQQTHYTSPLPSDDVIVSPASTRAAGILTPATSTGSMNSPTKLSIDSKSLSDLRDLIVECTGVSRSDMADERSMVDLGLDSLASVELVGELFSRFGIKISSEDLIESTLDDLKKLCSGPKDSNIHTVPESPALSIPRTPDPGETKDHGKAQPQMQKFLSVIVDVLGVNAEDFTPSATLVDLGLDSMSANDLKQELEDAFSVRLDGLGIEDTMESLVGRLGVSMNSSGLDPKPRTTETSMKNAALPAVAGGSEATGKTVLVGNPFDSLRSSDAQFPESAKTQKYAGHWAEVAPYEDEILLAYIVEAFASLSVNLEQATPGEELQQVPHQTHKYDKLIVRLWEILEKHGLALVDNRGRIKRGTVPVDKRTSAQLLAAFQERFPGYEHESNLIALTGPKLAQCLVGEQDAVSLMFGNPKSMRIMENFYGRSPMMSTLTEQLVIFLTTLLRDTDATRPVRILKVGAGTGGTTKRVVAALDAMGVSVEYTFTDIAPSLVSKAKNTLKQYSWIEYASFNLEKEVPEAFRRRFDIVISTNCVHATTDRTASCRRLRETLTEGGILVLSEVTRIIDWYDICFGLLDGWWLAEGRSVYPIQPASRWMSVFERAGFASASCSGGPEPEATSQQLLVACNTQWEHSTPDAPEDIKTANVPFRLETVVYKEVSDVRIHADIFFPTRVDKQGAFPIGTHLHLQAAQLRSRQHCVMGPPSLRMSI